MKPFPTPRNFLRLVLLMSAVALKSNAAAACVPVPSGLVGWWRGEGDATDSAGSNNGTLAGNVSFSTGQTGQAFSFDGDHDLVAIGNPASLQLQDFTVEAWIKRSDTNRASLDDLGIGGIFGYGYYGYVFGVVDDGRLVLGKNGISGVTGTRIVRDTDWHHVAVTKSGSSVVFYVDGVGETVGPYDPGFEFTTGAQIGSTRVEGAQPRASFLGWIDEVGVYNRGLASAEVGAIVAAGSAGKCSPARVTIEPNGGVFSGSVGVTLTGSGSSGSIYYTVDGGDPTTNSFLYSAAFTLTNSVTVKAAIFEGGNRASDIASATFVVLNTSGGCVSIPGLVGWWRGEGDATDSAGSNNGTLAGNVSFSIGQTGQAFSFDGDHDLVAIGNPASLQLQNFTVEAWIKRSDTNRASLDDLGIGGIFGYGYYGYVFGVGDDGRLVLGKNGISGVTGTRIVRDTDWHHVAVTKSGSSVVFYVDGVGETVGPYDPGFEFTTGAQIGSTRVEGAQPRASFLGWIDEVGVYNRGLASAEVGAIVAAGSDGKCPPARVTIEPNGGVFSGSVAVTLTGSGSSGSIYYTVDGGDPTTNSFPYSAAFTLTNSVTVKAAIFEGGNRASDIASATFVVLNTSGGCVSIPGLVGWWRGEGDATDSAGSNNGTLAGNVSFSIGQTGQAFSFDGDHDLVAIGNPASLRLQNFTVEAWIKRSDTNRASLDDLGIGGIFGYGYYGYVFGVGDDGRLVLGKNGISGVTGTRIVRDTDWHHVAVTKSGSSVVFYVDGVGETVGPYDPGFEFTTGAQIGSTRVEGAQPRASFLGWIDEVGVYNRGLASAEVGAIVAVGSAGKCPPKARALAHWTFDETSGTVARDSAGTYDGALSPTGTSFASGGVSSNALSISKAANGFASMGDVLGLTDGDYSLVAWIKMTAGDTTDSSVILSKLLAGSRNGYFLNVNTTGGLLQNNKVAFVEGGTGAGQLTIAETPISTTSVNDGNWHQVVAVYGAEGTKLIYVDGAPAEDSKPSQPFVGNSAPFLIGGYTSGTTPVGSFTGLIDEVQVYNYALTGGEVDYLFGNPSQVIPEHDLPVGWRVNVSASAGGSVARDPDLTKYTNGASVTLTATPGSGFSFAGWSGDATGTNNPLTLTVNSDKNIAANFVDGTAPVVTITTPAGGTVTDDMFVLSGDVTDNLPGVGARWEWNGQPVGSLTLNNGHFSVAGLRYYQGDNQLKVIGRDAAGNEGTAEVVVTWRPTARALAHWTFDETSGMVARDSAGTYDGALSPTGTSFASGGVSSNALSISKAANGFASMGDVLGLTDGDYSLVAWIKMTAGDTTDSSVILSKLLAGSRNGYFLNVNTTGGLLQNNKVAFVEGGTGAGQLTIAETPISTTSVNDGNWHQVVAVYGAEGTKLIYVDGAPAEDSKPSQPFIGNSAPFLIGGYTSGTTPVGSFTGLIDEVQVYNYALTGGEVDYLFGNPSQVIPEHDLPVGWSLNTGATGNGTVTRTPDLSRYQTGTNVTLTAVPGAGFAFAGWSGDAGGTTNPLTVTMNGNKTIIASFRDGTAPVVVITTPVGGTNTDERFQLTGTITDNQGVASAGWDWNGQSMGSLSLSSNQFSVGSLKLKRGENRIGVTATDVDGNAGTTEVVVTWAPERVLALVSPGPVQEGLLLSVPVQLTSGGEVGGMSFVMRYDTNYVSDPELVWSAVVGSALNQVNYDVPGEVRGTFALPATAVPGGVQTIATVGMRARSVPFSLTTDLGLEIRDVSRPTGDAIAAGSDSRSGSAQILVRRVMGDNNANDSLDVGDATIIQRFTAGLDVARSWDVTGNDLNANLILDSGDVIKVMRVVVGLDGQPQPQGVTPGHRTISKAGPRKAGGVSGSVGLSLDKTQAPAGELVTLQVRLAGLSEPLAGASFTVDYPTNALRLLNAASCRVGPLTPGTAVALWNVAPGQNDFPGQTGRVKFGASSANAWPGTNGLLAELVFEVQGSQTGRYLWPIRVSEVATADGYDPVELADTQINFIGRNQVPPSFGSTVVYGSNGVELTLNGEPGVTYGVEASDDLTHWTALPAVTSDTGNVTVVDPEAVNHPHRFYRAKAQ